MSETKPVWTTEDIAASRARVDAHMGMVAGHDVIGTAQKALAAADVTMPIVAAADALVAEVWQTTMPVLPTEIHLVLLRLRDALKQYHKAMADA